MTLVASFAALDSALARFDETLCELALTIDDVPNANDDPAVLDAVRAALIDARGDAAEAIQLIRHAGAAGDAIADCQQHCDLAGQRVRKIAAHGNLTEIRAVARERGGAWIRWSDAVAQSFERCEESLDRIAAPLLECWRELIDRSAGSTILKERGHHA